MGKRRGAIPLSMLTAAILILQLLLFLSPALVAAAQDGDYTYVLGGNPTVATITSYTGTGGDIIIPSTLGGHLTAAIGEMAFDACTSLASVVIPDSVTSIGVRAFSGCTNLSSVTIGENVGMIGGGAFQLCNLTSVAIPDSVIYVDGFAFGACANLASVTIGSGTTYIEYDAFGSCSSLTSIDVSASNMAYSSIEGVLFDKSGSVILRYPGGRQGPFIIPDGVSSIGTAAFSGSRSLSSLTIAESINSIDDWALSNCKDLTSIDIPDNVTSIGYGSFQNCGGLASVTFGGRLSLIGDYAFYKCSALTTLTVPDGVVTIGASAFSDCSALTHVTLGSGIRNIGQRAFAHCSSLISISFLGLGAPTTVGEDWLLDAQATMRGHAYAASDFPAPGLVWNGLTMGEVVPGGPEPESADGNELYFMVVFSLAALVLIAAILYYRRRKG